MRYLKYFALLAVLMVPVAYSQAQVSVGVAVGPGYVAGPPVCEYGYYDYYPYACAPYGFYGPSWFVNGVFIGAGPWYHSYRGWGHAGYWGRGDWGRGYRSSGWGYGREGYGRGYVRGGYERAYAGGGFRGERGGREFHGGGGVHGGGGFHGGGQSHGGGFQGGGSHGGGSHGGGSRGGGRR